MGVKLEILLDRPDRRYAPGEPVTGRVRVESDADCECRGLVLERFWRTGGRAEGQTGGEASQTLFQGRWDPGEQAYPFELPAPEQPWTYHGTILEVGWYLSARADVAWGKDPAAEVEIFVVPPPGAGRAPIRPDREPRPWSEKQPHVSGEMVGGLVMGLGGLLVISFLVELGKEAFSRKGVEFPEIHAVALGISTGILLLGIWLHGGLARTLRSFRSRGRIGKAHALVEPSTACPGQSVAASVTCYPRREGAIERVTGVLRCRERVLATGRDGHKIAENTHPVLEREFELAPGPALVGAVTCTGAVPVPEDGPCSFSVPGSSLVWSVETQVHGGGDVLWSEELPLEVVPPPAASVPAAPA